MANFDQLKQSVAALIRTNGAEEITGQIMQDVLLTIINSISGGYMFGGVAQHSGNVGNPDYNVFYLAGSGAYTGYGDAINIPNGCYGVFRYNGSWTQDVVDIGVHLTGTIREGETNGVTGDVINTALQQLFNNIMNILDTLTFTYNTPSGQQATKAMLDVIVTPTGGASHVLTTLTLVSATAAAAGLMSAEDKQKVDRMLTDFRSLSFSDTTAVADQATKIVQTLSATLGENPEAITTMTFLAATASKAGLLSAADKAKLDALWSSGYQFAGIATPSTTPISTTSKIFYIATEAGTYFNAVTVTQGINILSWNGTSWSAVQVIGIDDEPTLGNKCLVTSDAVAKGVVLMNETHPSASSADKTVVEMPIVTGTTYNIFLKSDVDVGGYIRVGLGGSAGQTNRSVAVSPEDVLAGITVSLTSITDGVRVYTASTDAENHDTLDDYSDFDTDATITWRVQSDVLDSQVARNKKNIDTLLSDLDMLEANNNYYSSVGINGLVVVDLYTIKFNGGGLIVRDFGHTGNNKVFLASEFYSALKTALDGKTIADDGIQDVEHDDTNNTISVSFGTSENRMTCLYTASTKSIDFHFSTSAYAKNKDEVILFTIVGRPSGLVFWEAKNNYMQDTYNRYLFAGYKMQSLYYSSSLSDVPILFDFPVIKGHRYKLSIKAIETISLPSGSDIDPATTTVLTVGLGLNGTFGNFTLNALNNGNAIYKTATTSARSRLYVSSINAIARNKDYKVTLEDVSEPESLRPSDNTIENQHNNAYTDFNTKWNKLYIGGISNTSVFANADPAISSSRAVAQIDQNNAIPYNGCTFRLHMPSYVRCNILHSNSNRGEYPRPSTGQSGWLSDGDEFTFPITSSWYRLGFAFVYSGSTEFTNNISPANISTLIRTGELYVEYNDTGSIIDNNKANEYYITGMMYKNPIVGTIGDNPNTSHGKVGDIPVVAHISDVHGDSTRFRNFLEYCEYLKVDAAILGGDFVGYNSSSGIDFINRISEDHDTCLQFFCIGNHEKNGFTEAQIHNDLISKFATRNDYQLGSETNANYYYRDMDDKKLRFIVLNQYDSDNISWTYAHISQTQMEWFIATLSSTPEDYGVILLTHSWEYYKIKREDSYGEFYDVVHRDGSMYPMEGAPILKILDTFISKGTIRDSYTQTTDNEGTTETISYSADFTDVAEGVEFIMWCNGHEHRDHIGYSYGETVNNVLICNISCGVGTYDYSTDGNYGLASPCDMPRGGRGQTQDCINIYAIDRGDGTVRIARVGANVNRYMQDRRWMIIPYREQ